MQQKTKSEHVRISEWQFFLSVVLAIVCIPIFSILVLNAFFGAQSGSSDLLSDKCSLNSQNQISIFTDRPQYQPGEKIALSMENDSDYSVYFEPCKFLNIFEKKVGEEWVLQEQVEEDARYFKDEFEKKDGNASCEDIALPPSGPGTYRMAVTVFYECKRPSRYACQRSELSYSNQFEVLAAADAAATPAADQLPANGEAPAA